MTTQSHLRSSVRWIQIFACLPIAMLGAIWNDGAVAQPAEKAAKDDMEIGRGITTLVEREPGHGPTTKEEQQHISVLGAQVLRQVMRARTAIDAEDDAAAETAIDKAQQAMKLIRQMLPKSKVVTSVFNANGELLYEDEDEDQADSVTILRAYTAVDIVRPLVTSRQEVAEVEGEEFEGHTMIEADVSLDLGFVERRLGAAVRALKKDRSAADAALAEAQVRGTSFTVASFESPLAEAREALEFAHQAVTDKSYPAAEANLRIARGYLLLYREIAPEGRKQEVDALNKEIDATAQQIAKTAPANHPAAVGGVKGMLDKVSHWWRKSKEPKATPTDNSKRAAATPSS